MKFVSNDMMLRVHSVVLDVRSRTKQHNITEQLHPFRPHNTRVVNGRGVKSSEHELIV
jgi:hypothetical protein